MAENRPVCVLCNRTVINRRRFEITHNLFEANAIIAQYIIDAIAPQHFEYNGLEYVCRPCWQRAQRAVHPNPNNVPHECTLQIEEYSRVANNAASCMFAGCRSITRHRIPENIRVSLLVDSNVFIPQEARVCDTHLRNNDWDEIIDSPNLRHDFNSAHFLEIMSLLKAAVSRSRILDFENIESMDNEEIHIRLGFNREQFSEILIQTPSLAGSNSKTTLAIYLTKLRSGESNERLATLFQMSRRTLERHLKRARDCLFAEFVPRHLGFDHIDRRMVAERNLYVPNALYGNLNSELEDRKAIVIMDGTYIYIQKSSNYSFQRETYSLHKFSNLLKPFLIVSCDGYIVDVCGPYAATDSDATILLKMIYDEQSSFHWFFSPGDIFILDRGFRDALPDLARFEYSAHIPETKDRGADQLTTEQANKSRMVTLCRWVVEVINGRLKRDFKLFRQDYFNRALNHMFHDFKIAASLINAFHEPIRDSVHANAFVDIINDRMNRPNHLADFVDRNVMNRQRATFQSITGDQHFFDDFPNLSEDDLTLLALGTYQVKLARSYYAEHLRQGLYNIEVYREQQISRLSEYIEEQDVYLLRVRIQSRHVRSRIYYSYIVIDRQRDAREAIAHYCCSCLSGRRTIGCCAHVMCVVWYLGWARNQTEEIRLPAADLSVIIEHDH
ncbi:unnamed protein product [Euphydryas editha]|uniref:DDE Tnp4 domain-containing protein n=1 Tax=Euphydryas editha TaxID=104508 RepID=A0AAU9TD66_EUPED|nr:unnamed protein product [Euphydryas editha]